MKLSIRTGTINNLIIKIVIIANIIDAGGGLGLKYVSTACLLISLILTHKKLYIMPKNFLFVFLPIINFFYSVWFCNIDPMVALSSVLFFLSVGFAIAIRNESESAEYWLKFYLNAMIVYAVAIIITFFIAYILSIMGMGAVYIDLGYQLNSLRMGFFGYRYYGNLLVPVVYPSSSMFLVFAVAIACYYQRLFALTIIFIACLVTGATGNVLFSLAIIIFFAFYLFRNANQNKIKNRILIAAFISFALLAVIIVYNHQILANLIDDFSSDAFMKSGGSRVKIGHITSILNYMFSDFRYFLFGMGAGSYFYSIGAQGMTANCEVSPLEYWREFGTLSFLLLLAYLFAVVIRLHKRRKKNKILSIGLFMMFLCTFTNPQFMSPLFFITLFLCDAVCDNLGMERPQPNL